jgi:hypothetical protein
VFGGLLAELDKSMRLAGLRTVVELDMTRVRRIGYGEEATSSL